MNDLKKREYEIIFFKNLNEYGKSVTKQDLTTAFYCFRDCVNSGLYNSVVFRVNSYYGYCNTSNPVMIFNVETGIKTGLKENIKNYYLNRFKNYIKTYGSSKPINFV